MQHREDITYTNRERACTHATRRHKAVGSCGPASSGGSSPREAPRTVGEFGGREMGFPGGRVRQVLNMAARYWAMILRVDVTTTQTTIFRSPQMPISNSCPQYQHPNGALSFCHIILTWYYIFWGTYMLYMALHLNTLNKFHLVSSMSDLHVPCNRLLPPNPYPIHLNRRSPLIYFSTCNAWEPFNMQPCVRPTSTCNMHEKAIVLPIFNKKKFTVQ